MSLIQEIRADIEAFLQQNNELFFNERDFQIHLAVYLRDLHKYDDVDVEYYVPYTTLSNYVWKNELRLDILVRKGNEFVPVELKYKTKKVQKSILRFNETIKDIEVMKNQGAQDLGMYDFWKDVRRIELVRNRFEHVQGGLAVFLTNDKLYLSEPKPLSNNYLFRRFKIRIYSNLEPKIIQK